MLVGGKVASLQKPSSWAKECFFEKEKHDFFEEEVGIVLFNLNNVVSVEKEASLRTFEDFHHFFWKDSNLNFCQKLLRWSGWWYLLFQSEYENFWNYEAMNNIDELLLEYSIRTYDVRRADWNKLACYFRFGRDWKKIKFIYRLKIFFNMAAIYSKLFCCVQWVHICLQIKNLLNIRWIDEIQVKCSQWGFSGIMVDWAQRCSLKCPVVM